MKFPNDIVADLVPQSRPQCFVASNRQEEAALDALMIAQLATDIERARGLQWEADGRAAKGGTIATRATRTVSPLLHRVLRRLVGLHGHLLALLDASLRVAAAKRGNLALSGDDLGQLLLVGWRLGQLQRARIDVQSAATAAPRASESAVDALKLAIACRDRALASLNDELARVDGAAAEGCESTDPVDLDARLLRPAQWSTSLDLLAVADGLFARGVGVRVWLHVVDAAAAAAPDTGTSANPAKATTGIPEATAKLARVRRIRAKIQKLETLTAKVRGRR